MIKLVVQEQTDDGVQSFLVLGDEPFRVEVNNSGIPGGNIIAHIYRGFDVDIEQEPDLVFDGNAPCFSAESCGKVEGI